jgi:hypothetical protein
MAEFPAPKQGIAPTHFIVSEDVGRSRRFYTDVLGGEAVIESTRPVSSPGAGRRARCAPCCAPCAWSSAERAQPATVTAMRSDTGRRPPLYTS